MLNSARVQKKAQLKESSEDIGVEEGKSSMVGDFLAKSPNMSKKKMDFGHRNHNEYMWRYSAK